MEKDFTERVAFDHGLKLGEICRGIRGSAFILLYRDSGKEQGLGVQRR